MSKQEMSKPESIVFVVDDDAAVREAIENLIRSVGLHVEAFASAQDFLRSKRPDVPGCLVLDIGCRASAVSNSSASWPTLTSGFRSSS